jgi:hypothetical protein
MTLADAGACGLGAHNASAENAIAHELIAPILWFGLVHRFTLMVQIGVWWLLAGSLHQRQFWRVLLSGSWVGRHLRYWVLLIGTAITGHGADNPRSTHRRTIDARDRATWSCDGFGAGSAWWGDESDALSH